MRVAVVITMTYLLIFILTYCFVYVAAAVELKRYRRRFLETAPRRVVRSGLAPAVSILVPAHNEETVIADSVRALLALDYPDFEIIVCSDGSTDRTAEVLAGEFDLRRVPRPTPPHVPHAPVREVLESSTYPLVVLVKEAGGRADALNAAANFARGELVLAVDADSILEQEALTRAVLPFLDDPDATVLTGGVVRVANGCVIEHGRLERIGVPRRALPMFQWVEYLRAFFAARVGAGSLNAMPLVSGAFGLFRRDAMVAAGGFRTDTIGEDFEMTLRLHRRFIEEGRPYRIQLVPDPVCWTQVPERVRTLYVQRRRWGRGFTETLLIHRRMLLNPRYGAMGLFILPAFLVLELLGPLIEMIGLVVIIVAYIVGTLNTVAFIAATIVWVGVGCSCRWGRWPSRTGASEPSSAGAIWVGC